MVVLFHKTMLASGRFISNIIKWIIRLASAIALAVVLVWGICGYVSNEGHSMSPVLNADDGVLINRFSYKLSTISRFDIVYFSYGDNNDNHSIKRVVGLPGETILIKDGKVLIDGKAIDMPEGVGEYAVAGIAEKELLLGNDEYFLLGDNGDSSEDSRFTAVGIVDADQIEGRVYFRLSPFTEIGFIGGD